MILITQNPHTGADISRFAFPKPARSYDCFNLLWICFCQCIYIWKLCIQIFYNNIDSLICTLCCQTHSYQKLPRLTVVIIERTIRIRIRRAKSFYDLQCKLLFCHM